MPPLSNLSSLSLAYRSTVGRRQPAATGVFSVMKYSSSFHPPPLSPPTASVASRHMHSRPQHEHSKTKMNWSFHEMKALYGEQMLTTAQSADVALAITKQLLQNEGKNSNVVFSPLSIHVLLSLIAAGSSGPTLDQLLSFLKSNSIDQLNRSASQIASIVLADGSPNGGPRLAFANGVWVDQSLSLKPSFKHLLHTAYKATLGQADFKTKADEVISEVNSWVKDHTNGLITSILSSNSINSTTYLILANALYFKGVWRNKFDASETEEQEFYLLDGSSVKVPFMTSQERQYIAAYDGFKVLKMPYGQGFDARQFSMYIFLPNDKDGLPSLIEKVNSQPGFIDRHIPREKLKVGEFKVPKFKFSFDVEMSNVLKKLGLVLPFAAGGGLSEMVESSQINQDAFVSKIFHKSFIEVNEKGTEAVAISFGCVGSSMMMPSNVDIIDFVADHPFLFAIREDVTKTLLFVGQVINPESTLQTCARNSGYFRG